tara:strand:- start:209 stop:799 length:591 start_codon:yes stop_codon:yes gene_type:complete
MAINAYGVGHLGQDAEISKTKNGYWVRFSIASNTTTSQGQQLTNWVRCSDFRKSNTNLAKYLVKGKQVFVRGTLESSKATSGVQYTTCMVNEIVLLGGGEQGAVNPNWTALFGDDSQTPPSQTPTSQEKIFFIGDANTQLPASQLTGKVQADTQVWTNGMASWLPASQVPELSHLFVTPPPQGPPPQTPINDENPF